MITGTVPVEVPRKLSELELDAGGKRIDNLGLGDTLDDVMRRSEKTESYEVYGLLPNGLAANRPVPGIVDQVYFSIDTLVLERDTGAAWVEVARGEAATRLAQLAERAHASLTGVGVADHHARYTDAEAQAQAAALIVIHAAIAAAHHTKTTDAAEIVSGTFPVARGGTGLSTIALGGILYASALDVLSRLAPTAANQVLRSTAANALQFAALLAADIPNLDAAKITSGRFPMARMPDMALNKIMVGRGAGNSPVEENKPTGISSGLIVMWHGTIANIPAGWLICDGNNSTPNLLTRFVEGVATAATDPGATGGSTSKSHASHYHTMGTHTHTVKPSKTETALEPGTYMDVADCDTVTSGATDPGNTNSKTVTAHSDIRPLFYDIAFIMKT
ncbi:hypothetical protein ES703_32283 [subsurface metagenome]